MASLIEYLEWDSHFFSFPVARVNSSSNVPKEWDNILHELKKNGIKLAYWQRPNGENSFKMFALENKAKLVDIKTTYTLQLSGKEYPRDNMIENYVSPETNQQLLNLSVQCGTFSRFAVDNNIPHSKFEELYRIWLINSINKSMADDILIYNLNESIVGMVTLYSVNDIGNIGLFGVDENYRKKGIGNALLNAVNNYFFSKGILRINVVTQGLNKPACGMYEKAGYTIMDTCDFYHFWLL
jgi:dTDP-4-amino-4,6-dideoxy-D-galactose acyltransferase